MTEKKFRKHMAKQYGYHARICYRMVKDIDKELVSVDSEKEATLLRSRKKILGDLIKNDSKFIEYWERGE